MKGAPGARTLTGSTGKDTIFDLAGAADDLADLTITDPDGAGDNDTLKIRSDQWPGRDGKGKVVNVENVEVVGYDYGDFSGPSYTGLKKVTVSRKEAGDGDFHVYCSGAGAFEIEAGANVTQLRVSYADGVVINAGADVTTVDVSHSSNTTVNSGKDGVEIDADSLTGTLAISGSNATVWASRDAATIDAAKLTGLLTLSGSNAVTVQDATRVDAAALTEKLILEGGAVEVKTATTGNDIDATSLTGTLTVKGTGEDSQSVTITTAAGATVNLDAGTTADDTTMPAIEATIDASAGAATVNGGSGSETVRLSKAPGGTFTFNGGDGDGDAWIILDATTTGAIDLKFDGGDSTNDCLIVNVDVMLGSGSKITNVETVTVNNGKTLMVDDTVFTSWDDVGLAGNLEINQTTDLDLSGIWRLPEDASIAITGLADACEITLDKDDGIKETITIRTKGGTSGVDLDAHATTITGFNKESNTVDTLVFEGRQAQTNHKWINDPVSSLEDLYNAANDGKPMIPGTAYYGSEGVDDGDSFVIMKDDDDGGIFAVILSGVTLELGSYDIIFEDAS